jgi:hypothetical protein
MNKKVISVFMCVFLSIFGFISCGTTSSLQPDAVQTGPRSIPVWYTEGHVDGYDVSEYLVGVGEGPTLEDAIADAQSTIAGQLKVSVESTIDLFRRETNVDGQINFFEIFSQNSSITVSETLKGSQIVKQEQVDGTFFVFAGLHKKNFLLQLIMELTDIQKQVGAYLAQARLSIASGLVFVAMENYSAAYELLVEYYTKKAYVDALDPKRNVLGFTSAKEVISEIRTILGAIGIEVVEGNNQMGYLGSELDAPVIFRVIYSTPAGGKIPISRIPVTIRSSDRASLGRYTSDAQGTLSVRVQAIPTSGSRGSITATLDMYSLMGEFSSYVGRSEAIVEFTIREAEAKQTVTLLLYDVQGKRMTNLERSASRELLDIGFVVTDQNPQWIIKGSASVIDEQEIQSFQGIQYVVRVELELELKDFGTDEYVDGVILTGNGFSLVNLSDATKNALNNIQFNRKNLLLMVSDIIAH